MAKSTVAQGEMVRLDPSLILADDNIRYGLKDTRIEALAASIKATGEVMVPVEIEPLTPPMNGQKYRLTTGFYRHAAVTMLNTQEGAGLTIPAIIRKTESPTERLKRQLAENMERENQSPMDQAMAIKKLLDAGIPKIEVREMFARQGGRKGNKVQPASNSFINMTLSFLELPKKVREEIHAGTVGTTAAYELTKLPPEKQEAVIERAKEERQKLMDREKRDEEKLLAAEAKNAEAADKLKQSEDAITTAKDAADTAKKLVDTLADASIEAHKAMMAAASVSEKKTLNVAYKAADKAYNEAKAASEKAASEYQKLEEKHNKTVALANEHAAKLKAARNEKATGATAKKAAVSGTDVKKAAKEAGAATAAVPLSAKECRDVAHYLTLPGGDETLIAIGKQLEKCFLGQITDKQCYKELQKIVS